MGCATVVLQAPDQVRGCGGRGCAATPFPASPSSAAQTAVGQAACKIPPTFPRPPPHRSAQAEGRGRAIRHGFPWVYADELVMDRRTRAGPRGAGGAGGCRPAPAGAGHGEPGLEDHRPGAGPRSRGGDRSGWLAARLATALALRARLYDAPFYRLVHAEADGLPGVVIDRFGDAAVIQPNAAWAEAHLDALADALVAGDRRDARSSRTAWGGRAGWKGWSRKRWSCGAPCPARCRCR
jgi:hypothetical protein